MFHKRANILIVMLVIAIFIIISEHYFLNDLELHPLVIIFLFASLNILTNSVKRNMLKIFLLNFNSN